MWTAFMLFLQSLLKPNESFRNKNSTFLSASHTNIWLQRVWHIEHKSYGLDVLVCHFEPFKSSFTYKKSVQNILQNFSIRKSKLEWDCINTFIWGVNYCFNPIVTNMKNEETNALNHCGTPSWDIKKTFPLIPHPIHVRHQQNSYYDCACWYLKHAQSLLLGGEDLH